MFIKKIIIICLLLLPLQALPNGRAMGGNSLVQNSNKAIVQAKPVDARAQVLSDYLATYNSPLQYHAQDFIDAADKNSLDWKLVPAISGVESTFGKVSYGYNAWGWGIYGDQALNFASWRDGIFTVSTGLKQNYVNKGLTDPLAMNRVYAASPTWGTHVNFFLNDLNKFITLNKLQTIQLDNNLSFEAGSSATLALNYSNEN